MVHEAVLLDSGSPSLRTLVQPGWKESSEHSVQLEHTNTQTIERVLTFLYHRDYESPDPVKRGCTDDRLRVKGLKDEVDTGGHEIDPEERADDYNVGAPVTVADGHPAEDTVPLEDIVPTPLAQESPASEPEGVEGEDLELQDAILESCSVRPLTPLGRCVGLSLVVNMRKTAGGIFEDQDFPFCDYSYRELLLAHAEVYAFAKYHMLPSLQELALQRMIQTLRKIDCSVEDAQEELSDVIEFVYDHIPVGGCDEEPMRKLLAQFAAINYTLLLAGKFEELLSRGGEFALALARKLSRRLSAHGVAAEMKSDDLDQRIQNLESQIRERDESIRSLNQQLSDASVWGRGINRKGGRRGW